MNSKRISIASAAKPAFTGIKPAEAVRVSTATVDRLTKSVVLRPWPAKGRPLHSSKDIEGFLKEMTAQGTRGLERRSPIFPPHVRVSEYSAVVAVTKQPREFTTLFGVRVRIQPKPGLVRISPQSEVPILNR